MKYSGEGNVINDGRFNRDSVFLVGSDDQLLIFHSCLIFSEYQLFWTLSERMLGGNFVLMLSHTILKTIFRFIYLEALFKYLTSLKNGPWTSFSHFLLQTFQRWSLCRVQVHWRFWPNIRLKHTHAYSSSDVLPMTRPRYTEYFLMGPTLSSQTRSPLWNFEVLPSFLFQVNICTVNVKVKVYTS